MTHTTVHFQLLHDNCLPQRMSATASGYDLVAALDGQITLYPGERALVPCGFAMALEPGYEGQIRPRSGIALKYGITVLNAPGTIDSDYRGEVGVILINLGQGKYDVVPGARIAQLVIAKVINTYTLVVMDLSDTLRGTKGFGSTGD